MSKLTEWILRQIVLSTKRWGLRDKGLPTDGNHTTYFKWQFETSEALFGRYPNFDPAGKSVLEIGCGIGGRTAYLASRGAKPAIGIDINAAEIELAKSLCARCKPELVAAVQYVASQENAALPDIGQFDLVLLVDSMEHVVSPPNILRLAYHYTKPGGKCYFNTIGWFHYAGSHTPFFPFVNLFFSDETILNVMRWWVSRPEYRLRWFDSQPPVERWRGIYNLRDRPGEHLNKITVAEIKKLVRHTIFRSASITITPFTSPNPLVRIANPLRHVPLLQEVFHSGIVVELQK